MKRAIQEWEEAESLVERPCRVVEGIHGYRVNTKRCAEFETSLDGRCEEATTDASSLFPAVHRQASE